MWAQDNLIGIWDLLDIRVEIDLVPIQSPIIRIIVD